MMRRVPYGDIMTAVITGQEAAMARTTVNIDNALLARVQKLLGTTGVSETVNAALRETLRRAELAGFSLTEFDITDASLADSRGDRAIVA
jgi:Arc/MetJ family transcription regulator